MVDGDVLVPNAREVVVHNLLWWSFENVSAEHFSFLLGLLDTQHHLPPVFGNLFCLVLCFLQFFGPTSQPLHVLLLSFLAEFADELGPLDGN